MEHLPRSTEYHLDQLGVILKARRKRAKLTQKAMGKLIGVDEQTISHWETGRRGISDLMLAKFCLQCGCKMADIDKDILDGKGGN